MRAVSKFHVVYSLATYAPLGGLVRFRSLTTTLFSHPELKELFQ